MMVNSLLHTVEIDILVHFSARYPTEVIIASEKNIWIFSFRHCYRTNGALPELFQMFILSPFIIFHFTIPSLYVPSHTVLILTHSYAVSDNSTDVTCSILHICKLSCPYWNCHQTFWHATTCTFVSIYCNIDSIYGALSVLNSTRLIQCE